MSYLYFKENELKLISNEKNVNIRGEYEIIKSKLSIHDIFDLTEENEGVAPKDFDWTNPDKPKVSKEAKDAKKLKDKKKKIKKWAKEKYALLANSNPIIDRALLTDQMDILSEVEWQELEMEYDNDNG